MLVDCVRRVCIKFVQQILRRMRVQCVHKQGKGVYSWDRGNKSAKRTANKRGVKSLEGAKEKRGSDLNMCVCVCDTVKLTLPSQEYLSPSWKELK